MRFFLQTFLALVAVTMSVAGAAGLHYNPHEANEDRDTNLRALQVTSGSGLKGCWSSISQFGFCVDKVDDPADTTSDQVKFLACNNMKRTQFWKFDKFIDDDTPNKYGGLLYNMAGGCLAIRGDYETGKNLKVMTCNRNNPKQHWISDGEFFSPRDSRGFCVSSPGDVIKARDPVILIACSDTTYSFDY
jgi:Ricin-type beta-trefoil lectin domain